MYFDRNNDLIIHYSGHLPHMHQDEALQSVTFRLADSLPQSACRDLIEKANRFKERYPLPWDQSTKLLYWKEIGPIQQKYLDNGYGSCMLKYPECRQILIDSIAFKDDINYKVYSYVIMPNHVHMLIMPLEDNKLEKILHSIKLFSSRRINKLTGSKGKFWMKESFDRLVRNEEDHRRCYHYILDNPRFLPEGTFTVYIRDRE